jgi:hypothetical protein
LNLFPALAGAYSEPKILRAPFLGEVRWFHAFFMMRCYPNNQTAWIGVGRLADQGTKQAK